MFAWVAIGMATFGVQGASAPARVVDPSGYTSPGTTRHVKVDPSDRTGKGPAQVRYFKEGKPAWSKEFPFTLQDLFVADDGMFVGYAMTHGTAPRSGGELVVAAVSGDGEIVFEERIARKPATSVGEEDDPRPLGVVGDPANGRVLLRIADADPARAGETWWSYSLADGSRGREIDPLAAFPFDPASRPRPSIVAVEPLNGVPLVLVACLDARGATRDWSGSFALLDAEGAAVWTLDRAADYEIAGDEASEAKRVEQVLAGASVIETGQDGRFALWFAREGQRVDFQVSNSGGTYGVAEIARVSHVAKSIGEIYELPTLDLGSHEPMALQPDPAALSFFTELQAYAIGEDGNFHAIDRDVRRDYLLRVIDGAGNVVSERRLDSAPTEFGRARAFARESGGDWIAAYRGDFESAKLHFVRIRAATGALEPLLGDRDLTRDGVDPSVAVLVALRDGGFAALLERSNQFTTQVDLAVFGPDGSLRVRRDENFDDPSAPFSAKDLAVSESGDLVVLEHVRRALKVFGVDGAWKHTLEPQDAALLTFPSGVECGPGGEFVIFDFSGEAKLLRCDAKGATIARYAPHLRDGTMGDVLARNARLVAGGDLWTTEGRAFHRLAPDGSPGATIGAAPSGGVIERPGHALADVYGRFLVRDDADGAVHVFQRDGVKSLVLRPESGDPIARVPGAGLATDGEGGVLVLLDDGRGWLRFDVQGRRVGVVPRDLPLINARDGKNMWALDPRGEATLLAEDGKVLRTLARGPDDRWLRAIAGGVVTLDRTLILATDHSVAYFAADPAQNQLLDLASTDVRSPQVASTTDWTVLWTPANVTLLRNTDAALFRAKFSAAPTGGSRVYGTTTDGRYLVEVELPALTVRRYALP